ncbi:acetyl-CoA carboxylase biotin carboxyl carrier protein subunit, partial [Mesorhizobium sp. M7A.F.Ca.CA.001.15.1.1]
MDLDFVQKLIEFVSRSPIAELEIERDGVRIRISRQAALA